VQTIEKEIKKYNDKLEVLRGPDFDNMELYRWVIELGKKLKNNPLSEHLRVEENRVSRCQFNLFVDREEDIFKAFSDGYISSGYAFILLDVFNALTSDEQKQVTIEDFKGFKVENLLTMTRSDGFYQMIEMMIKKAGG
jgi:cysteine desulfuration protein SufE